MAYTPYYAPYSRPMGYYNPSIPQQDMSNMQANQQMPVQQQMQQPVQQMPMQTPMPFMHTQPTNDMLFVLNENEASAYPVAPNNSVVLWDKNNKTFYIKTANAQGVPSMQIYDFTERAETYEKRTETHECKCGDKFVTKEEFDALKGKFYDLQARYDRDVVYAEEKQVEKSEKPKTTTKKTKESEE
jgi:hypothetical protein